MINIVITPAPSSSPICFLCGSRLILVERKTEKIPLHFSPTITTIYKCSNINCENAIDRATIKKLQRKGRKIKTIKVKKVLAKTLSKGNFKAKKVKKLFKL